MIDRLATMDMEALALSPLDDESLPVAHLDAVSPRDEAAAFLAFAAEVEHALMLQYLYAAYSVRCDQDKPLVRNQMIAVRHYLLQIAREEMGHLMTVQNLLGVIGAPLYLGRNPELDRCGLYPFRFTLEPLSSGSLAKYITAERPNYVADPELRRKLDHIAAVARQANGDDEVKHIGAIYERLLALFGDPHAGLQDGDFRADTGELRARWSDWGYDETLADERHCRCVYVQPMDGDGTRELRTQALAALRFVLEQGEGYTRREDGHADRFLEIYDLLQRLEQRGVAFTWPVATNPKTVPEEGAAYIENAAARAWAELCNLRYQLLLGYIHHFLHVAGPRYVQQGQGVGAESLGDPTPRGLLLQWAFDEMRHLSKIAAKLTSLPLRHPDDRMRAGPPFELRARVAAVEDGQASGNGGVDASREGALWREHARIVERSRVLVRDLLDGCVAGDPFLEDLQAEDGRTAWVLDALASGQPIPECHQPRAFQKVAHVLEQAARGFTMPAHGNFWAGITRDQFVETSFYGMRFLGSHPGDPARYSAGSSFLVKALAKAMPALRPTIDESRQSFIAQWVDEQAPDGTPPDRIGVYHERDPILDRGVPPGSRADTDD